MAQTSHKEIPKSILDEQFPMFLESYKHIKKVRKAAPCSWIAWSDDLSKVRPNISRICHAALLTDGTGFDELVTSMPFTDEPSLTYQKMLISGPFKAMSDLISLESIGKQYYIRCSRLDKWPAKVLYNYCIATRVPVEHEGHLKYFMYLIEKGYHPTLAYLLSYSVEGKDTLKERIFPANGHFWFDASAHWPNILESNFQNIEKGVTFKAHPMKSIPTNVIWGKNPENGQMRRKSNEELAEKFGLPIEVIVPPPVGKKFHQKKVPGMFYEPPQINVALQQMQADVIMQEAMNNLDNALAGQVPQPIAGGQLFAQEPGNGNWHQVNFNHINFINNPAIQPAQFDNAIAPGPQPEIDEFDDIDHDDFDDDHDDF